MQVVFSNLIYSPNGKFKYLQDTIDLYRDKPRKYQEYITMTAQKQNKEGK